LLVNLWGIFLKILEFVPSEAHVRRGYTTGPVNEHNRFMIAKIAVCYTRLNPGPPTMY